MKSLFTIRKKKHAKPPQIIVYADRIKFKSVTLTHTRGRKKHWNIKLKFNPNPNDNRDAYFSKKVLEDFKFNFSKAFSNYNLSNEDIDLIIEYLESKKKK